MSKHTAGPWKQHLVDDALIIAPDGGHIATVSGDYDIEYGAMEANARLIAAAPDLLDALTPFAKGADNFDNMPRIKNPEEWFVYSGISGGDIMRQNPITIGDLRRARAAIAKATGEE